jgi:hypothetical protein
MNRKYRVLVWLAIAIVVVVLAVAANYLFFDPKLAREIGPDSLPRVLPAAGEKFRGAQPCLDMSFRCGSSGYRDGMSL